MNDVTPEMRKLIAEIWNLPLSSGTVSALCTLYLRVRDIDPIFVAIRILINDAAFAAPVYDDVRKSPGSTGDGELTAKLASDVFELRGAVAHLGDRLRDIECAPTKSPEIMKRLESHGKTIDTILIILDKIGDAATRREKVAGGCQ